MTVWSIEQDAEYLAWLAEVQSRHRHRVGKTLILAEERDDTLFIGVRLNTDDEFWKPWQGSFQELLQKTIQTGMFMQDGYKNTRDHFPTWEQVNGPVQRLEFVSSHVGGLITAIMQNGKRFILDET